MFRIWNRGSAAGISWAKVAPVLLGWMLVAATVLTTAPQARAGAEAFLAPVVVGQRVSEPGMHVAPDGTLYIEGPTGVLSVGISSPSVLFRSRDDGATWVATAPGLRSYLPGGGDSTLAIAPNGDLAFADLWAGSSTVSRSSDRGDSWIPLPAAGLPVQDRPWLANSGTAVYLAYHQLPGGIGVSKSFGDGLFYPLTTLAATIVDQEGCVTCASGTIVAAPGSTFLTDRVGLVFSTQNGGVKFSRSLDGGLTWSVKPIAPSGNADTTLVFPTVADAGGGNLAATWLEVTGTRSLVRLATSTDWGDTWSPPRTLTAAGTSVYPWVAARGSKIAISLYWNSSDSTPDTTPADTPWYESYTESTDFGATFTPLVAADPTPVKLGPICTGGSSCAADRELGDFQSVAIDLQGRSDLAYNRSTSDGTEVEVRFTRQC